MKFLIVAWVACGITLSGLMNGHFRCTAPQDYFTEEGARAGFLKIYAISMALGPIGLIPAMWWGGLATQYQLVWAWWPMTEQEYRRYCWTIIG